MAARTKSEGTRLTRVRSGCPNMGRKAIPGCLRIQRMA
jgi:hypothetical protein